MNHPIHPESDEFAGLVMGREAVAVTPALPIVAHGVFDIHGALIGCHDEPCHLIGIHSQPLVKLSAAQAALAAQPLPARTLEQIDAHHAKLMAALDEKDAEIARLTAAGPVAAQPQGDPVAWAVYAEVGGEMLAQYPPSSTL